MAKDKLTKPQPFQVHGVEEDIKQKFRVYAVAHKLSQAEAFTKAVLALLSDGDQEN